MRFRIAKQTLILTWLWNAVWAQSDWVTRVDSVRGPIHTVIWTGNLALAIGEQGHILSSPDGAHWTTRDSGGPPWHSLIRTGNGLYLANSWFGPQALSDDGLHWARSRQEASISSAAALGTKTLGTDGSDDSGYLYLSMNDTVWKRVGADSQEVAPVRNRISGLASNGRIVVAVGSHWVEGVVGSGTGLSAVSTDGERWSFRKSQGFKGAFRVRWVNDRFFALHLGVLASSFDGLDWSPAGYLPPAAFPLDVTWSGRQFIAVGASGLILASEDGSTWQEVPNSFGVQANFSSVAWTGSRLVLAGSRDGYRYIVTTDRNALAVRPGGNALRPHLRQASEGGWVIRRLPSAGWAGRARLFDARGRVIRELRIAAGAGQVRMPLSGLGRGIYILKNE